jgi:hypothetical protein
MFEFLSRVSGPVWDRIRDLVKRWVQQYPIDHRADVIGRIRSGDDEQLRSAVWELTVFYTLRACGFEPTCHPELPHVSSRPDFRVDFEGSQTYIEARIVGESGEDSRAERRKSLLEAQINDRVSSELYFVSIEYQEVGDRDPPVAALAERLRAWLTTASSDDVSTASNLFSWSDVRTGWAIIFRRTRKNYHDERDRVIGGRALSFGFVDDVTPLRKGISKKLSKYGADLDGDLLVALGTDRPFADDFDLQDIICGQPARTSGRNDHCDVHDVHFVDGLLTRRRDGSRHNRALITCLNPKVWNLNTQEWTLWTAGELSNPLFNAFHFAGRKHLLPCGALDERQPTAALGRILQLPVEWPGPESPFPPRSKQGALV